MTDKKKSFINIVLLLGFAFLIFYSQKNLNDLDKKIKKNNTTIESLEGDLILLKRKNKDVLEGSKINKESLNYYNDVGKNIESYQNEFKKLNTENVNYNDFGKVGEKLGVFFEGVNAGPTPWYFPPESHKLDYKWHFLPNLDFRGAKIPMLFECRDEKTGDILAYVKCNYDVSIRKITDVNKNISEKGSSYLDQGKSDLDDKVKGSDGR